MKFCVIVLYQDGNKSVLSVKGRTAWTRRTALKHMREFMAGPHRNQIAACSLEFA